MANDTPSRADGYYKVTRRRVHAMKSPGRQLLGYRRNWGSKAGTLLYHTQKRIARDGKTIHSLMVRNLALEAEVLRLQAALQARP